MRNSSAKTNKKSTIIAISVLAAMLLVCGICWSAFMPKPTKEDSGSENAGVEQGSENTTYGDKCIVVEITHKDGKSRVVEITTDADYLYDAMKQEKLIGESDNGMVYTVDGETVDSTNEEWWGYTKSGEYVSVGVTDCVISDGEHYEFVLHVGYDELF